MKGEVFMVVLDLGLEVLTNQIGLHDEDTLGSPVDSFDSMIYKKNCGFIARKYFEEKDGFR